MVKVGVIIAAGGSGRRLGGSTPKQFLVLGTKTMLEISTRGFDSHPLVSEIVVVAPRKFVPRVSRIMRTARLGKVTCVVAGGATRQDSVWNGMNAMLPLPDIILVHDAARPFVTKTVITRVIMGARKHGAAVVGVRVKDTIKVEKPRGFYARTLDRNSLWAVQTPQGFGGTLLMRAHRAARTGRFVGTDEASLVERLGRKVRIIEGNERNLKVTSPDDMEIARMWSRKRWR
jgi:2-C-methyl-D-erythritol 4-phosphate cytidylyltransferase